MDIFENNLNEKNKLNWYKYDSTSNNSYHNYFNKLDAEFDEKSIIQFEIEEKMYDPFSFRNSKIEPLSTNKILFIDINDIKQSLKNYIKVEFDFMKALSLIESNFPSIIANSPLIKYSLLSLSLFECFINYPGESVFYNIVFTYKLLYDKYNLYFPKKRHIYAN